MTLVSPGPFPTITAPSPPVASAWPQAMNAAPVSVCVRTNRTPASSNASMRSRLLPPPGNPNTVVTPAAARRPASSAPTV